MPDDDKKQAGAADQDKKGDVKKDDDAAGQKKEAGDQVPLAALQDERNKRQTLEARLKQFEATFGDQVSYDAVGNIVPRQTTQNIAGNQLPTQPSAAGHAGSWDQYHSKLNEMWETDPRKAMETEVTTAFQWYDQVHSSVEDQMDQMATKAKDFDQYRPQIRNYLRKLPLDQRGKPGIVEAAYFLQKGQQVDSVIENERKAMAERLEAGESIQGIAGGSSGVPVAGGGSRTFTKDEVAIAAVYGMKPDEYFGKK